VRALRAVVLGAMALCLIALPARAASAATAQPARASVIALDNAALNWAETQAGKPYSYGAAGPWAYDCSGLVMAAFAHVGISLPHSTYAMLGSWHLVQVPLSQVRRGDLLFYGSGHVEFATDWQDTSFGAHDWGAPVGWIRWGPWWYPTMAFEVI
jgi:cell wall-associated NlpC family hydrolase